MAKKFALVESFGPTIQGEGSVIGTQTIFLRFGGCDYKCERCDSLHAVLPEIFSKAEGTMFLTMPELIAHTLELCGHAEWVTFSGGNPCMWDLAELVDALILAGKKISVETQGTLWQDWLLKCHAVTVSPKGPGMGAEFEEYLFQQFVDEFNEGNYEGYFSIKVVLFDQRDIEFFAEILAAWPELRDRSFASIGNWQPPAPALRKEPEEDSYEDFVLHNLESTRLIIEELITDQRLASVRILPQLHALIWGNGQGF